MTLSNYIPLCKAIVALMSPLVEVVIHDLNKGSIYYIEGNLSKRQIGDPSLLSPDELDKDIGEVIYSKLNFDGRLIRSISVPIEGNYLFCINFDVSIFNQLQALSHHFLEISYSKKPEALFKNDWQEKLHISVHAFLKEKGWDFQHLSNSQKKILVENLYSIGAFSEKNAADYIAEILKMGRATIFKYLKEWR
ncbi:MAG: hypothetical protein K0Q51_47 [Rickettsiaceae bacterium]|jgi:predicted transcriptional regulator YheO|nr:hypothetical protein [Rickettsiaceae bacterium]